jgi:hypothetical protein
MISLEGCTLKGIDDRFSLAKSHTMHENALLLDCRTPYMKNFIPQVSPEVNFGSMESTLSRPLYVGRSDLNIFGLSPRLAIHQAFAKYKFDLTVLEKYKFDVTSEKKSTFNKTVYSRDRKPSKASNQFGLRALSHPLITAS